MNALTSIFALWEWPPVFSVLLIFFLLWAGWLLSSKTRLVHWIYFSCAFLMLIAALASPVAVLSNGHLFSAHMLQHILLLMVIPPLLWLSIPEKKQAPPAWLNKFRLPLGSWIAGVGLMWLLHFPLLFNEILSPFGALALCSGKFTNLPISGEWIHGLHLGLSLLIGLWFVFPILAPWKKLRLRPLKGITFLVSACTACSVLGILITFAPAGTFYGFGLVPDITGIQQSLHSSWGMTVQVDQQIGGLLMWVPGCFIYLSGSLYLLNKWFSEESPNPYSKNIEKIKPAYNEK